MKKTGFLLIFAALFLSACNKKQYSGELIELNVWGSDNISNQFVQTAGEIYSKKHPGITVNCIYEEFDDAITQISGSPSSVPGPDLIIAPHTKLPELAGTESVIPARNPQKLREQALSSCVQSLTYNGKIYGYPLSAETYALFYNKKLISEESIPRTWEELAEFSKRFNGANSGRMGFAMDVGNSWFTVMFVDPRDICSAQSVEGMSFFQKKLRPVFDLASGEISTSFVNSMFAEELAAMCIAGSWDTRAFAEAGLDFGVAPLPSFAGQGRPCHSVCDVRAVFVSARSVHQEEASAFAEFLLSPSMQNLRSGLSSSIPSVKLSSADRNLQGFSEQLNHALPSLEAEVFWEVLGTASQRIWDGADIQEELNEAADIMLGF